jgi:hypothetical protein
MPRQEVFAIGWRHASRHPFTTVFFLALVVRLINVALLSGDSAFFAELDSGDYWAVAKALANPGTFGSTFLSMTWMPLYPLFLAGVQATFGEAPRAVAIIQAVIDAGTCALIAALAALISPRVGLVAGIVAALSVNLVVYSSQALSDCLFLFFFTLMLLAGARFLRWPSNGLAILAGAAGGLALATRPAVGLLLLAAPPVVFLIDLTVRRSLARALTAAVLFALGAALPVTPVLLRNIIHYRSFSLTAKSGEHLAFEVVPLVVQRADGTPYWVTRDRMNARYQRWLESPHPALNNPNNNPFLRSTMLSELSLEEMRWLPWSAFVKAWLEGMVVTLGAPALIGDPRVRALPKPSFWGTPGATLWERARAYLLDNPGRYQVLVIAGVVTTLPFVILAVIGFVILAHQWPWTAVLAAGVLIYFLLVNGPVATAKYRLPMEPVLIVLAAIPLEWLIRRPAVAAPVGKKPQSGATPI